MGLSLILNHFSGLGEERRFHKSVAKGRLFACEG